MKILVRPKDPERQKWWDAAWLIESQIVHRRCLAEKRLVRGSRKSRILFEQVVARAVLRDASVVARCHAMRRAVGDRKEIDFSDWVDQPIYSTIVSDRK